MKHLSQKRNGWKAVQHSWEVCRLAISISTSLHLCSFMKLYHFLLFQPARALALSTALQSFYSKLSLAHTPFLKLLNQVQPNPPIHQTWYWQSLTCLNLTQPPNRLQTWSVKRPKNTFLLWNHSVTSENIRSCFSFFILLRRDLHVKAAIFLHLAESSFTIIIEREIKNSPQYLWRRS